MNVKGSIVALVTPFDRQGRVDTEQLIKNIKFQLENRTDGFVVCGTTGEAPTLSEEEWELVITTTIKTVAHKKPVIVGCGTNATDKTIKFAKRAEALKASSLLVVTPYYNKPTQAGLFRHFENIVNAISIPIIIYNIPSRCGVNMLPSTIERLYKKYPTQIIGVKEASGSLDQCQEIINICGNDFILLSGDDSLTLPILSIGGRGIISVIANIVPRMVSDMVRYFLKGKVKEAQKLNRQLFALSKVMF
ncbi:MAG: 4-hydroxy-tetrahydrodipicolinate synthase, partial [candidate division WOR-3 bacterium]|nr:4-hydroxy-tetrahydrodipicolinate synthase [candidate division WOR-3 bacterium]